MMARGYVYVERDVLDALKECDGPVLRNNWVEGDVRPQKWVIQRQLAPVHADMTDKDLKLNGNVFQCACAEIVADQEGTWDCGVYFVVGSHLENTRDQFLREHRVDETPSILEHSKCGA